MNKTETVIVALALGLFLSLALLMYSAFTINKANNHLAEILNITDVPVQQPSASEPENIDEQILDVQNKLRVASNGIRNRKYQIRSRVTRAIREIDISSERSLQEAKNLLAGIAINSGRILKQNEEIEAKSMKLYSLYQKKIETILAAKEAQEKSKFGISFWVAIIGIISTVSGIIIAWRKDRFAHFKEKRHLEKRIPV